MMTSCGRLSFTTVWTLLLESKSTTAEVSEVVKETGRRVKGVIEAGRKPGMPLSIAREAPLRSLLIAFLLGIVVARRGTRLLVRRANWSAACQASYKGSRASAEGLGRDQVVVRLARQSIDDFLGDNRKARELRRPECSGDSHVRSIAAARNDDAADPRAIVPGIETVPSSVEENLEPGTEIHWGGVRRYADVAEITGAVPRGYVDAATKGHGEMCKVAAHADAFFMALECRSVVPRMRIAELESVMDVIADRLHALPASCQMTEHGPGQVGELLRVAVAAAKKIDQSFIRKLIERTLRRVRDNLVRQTAVLDDEFVAYLDETGGSHQPRANVTEDIKIIPRRNVRIDADGMVRHQIRLARWMNAEHEHHRHLLRAIESNLVASTDFQDELHCSLRKHGTTRVVLTISSALN